MVVDLRSYTLGAAGPPVPELVAAPRVRLHATAGAWLGAEEPTSLERLWDWWKGWGANAHQFLYSRAAGALTGLKVPAEVSEPSLVPPYLADALVSQGQLRRWPQAQVERFAAAIRAVTPASSVGGTIDRVVMLARPPREWPGVEAWYGLAQEMKASAALLSAGETAGYWRSATRESLEQARRGLLRAAPTLREMFQTATTTASRVATGVGLGSTVLLLGGGAIALAILFGPELATAAGAATVAKAATRRRR